MEFGLGPLLQMIEKHFGRTAIRLTILFMMFFGGVILLAMAFRLAFIPFVDRIMSFTGAPEQGWGGFADLGLILAFMLIGLIVVFQALHWTRIKYERRLLGQIKEALDTLEEQNGTIHD